MCNACGFQCCAWDGFSGCGCDDCDNPECWEWCNLCGESGHREEDCMDLDSDDDEYEEYNGWP